MKRLFWVACALLLAACASREVATDTPEGVTSVEIVRPFDRGWTATPVTEVHRIRAKAKAHSAGVQVSEVVEDGPVPTWLLWTNENAYVRARFADGWTREYSLRDFARHGFAAPVQRAYTGSGVPVYAAGAQPSVYVDLGGPVSGVH